MRTLILGDPHGGHKAMIQCFERANFSKENDELIVLGDVCDGWPETKQCIDELMTCKNLIYILGNHDCLSSDTEVLTKRGWLYYDQINIDDLVYSYNIAKDNGEWVEIDEIIIKDFDGYLNLIDNNHVNLLCTDNHRILHSKRMTINGTKIFTELGYKHFDDLSGRISIPISVVQEKSELKLSEDELKLIAWILTDGSCLEDGDRTNQYQIYQSKRKNIPYITKLLRRIGYDFTLDKRKRITTEICGKKIKNVSPSYTFRILNNGNKRLQKILPFKYPFYERLFDMSQEQFEIFIKEIIKGDGSTYNHTENSWILYGEEKFLDEIQILCILNGYRASKTKDTRNNSRLNIGNFSSTQLDVNIIKGKERYSGKVWCLSVPNTNFMVRRNGRHYFTGNCWALEWALHDDREPMWVTQGGWNTLLSYDFKMPQEHIDFLNNSYLFMEDDGEFEDGKNILFVHGGIDPHLMAEKCTKEKLLWDRDLLSYARRVHKREELRAHDTGKEFIKPEITMYSEVFIGHTTTSYYGSLKPLNFCNVWDLDTGAGWEGPMTIMDLETKEYWQSDLVCDLYNGNEGRRSVDRHTKEIKEWLEGGEI